MSMGPIGGILGSAAGAPLSQTKGSETERAARDGASRDAKVQGDKLTEKMSGVGQASEGEGATDRDADGRKLWEGPPEGHEEEQAGDEKESPKSAGVVSDPHLSKDPNGISGSQLDLQG